jgi:hypothetical protein
MLRTDNEFKRFNAPHSWLDRQNRMPQKMIQRPCYFDIKLCR